MVAIKRIVISVLLLTLAACATQADGLTSKEPPHKELKTEVRTEPSVYAQLANVEAYLAAVQQQQLTDYFNAVKAEQDKEALDAYLASLAPPPQVQQEPTTPDVASTHGGARSYAWWEAIATCESGNTNAWRTGYYGLEGGPGVTYGGLGKDAQLAIAEGIYANYGDGAWGCAATAWAQVPSG